MGSRADGDIVGCDVNTHRQTFLVDIGEVVAGLLSGLVCHVKADMVDTMNLHLLINGTCHNITGSQ